jgi:hypothetical protein
MNPKSIIIALAICAAGISPAFANPQVNMATYNAGAGGNYRANPNAELEWVLGNYVAGKSTDGTWFGTFCIEKNEYFSNGGLYDIAFNDRAIAGGVSSPTAGFDIISQGTAFLYTQFATGMLSASYYGSSTNAAALQDLIWWLEGEQGSSGAGTYNSLLQAQFGANWMVDAKADYTGSAVKVMNLTSNTGRTKNQDQLVYVGVPDGGTTVMLLGLGLIGLSIFSRRVRNTA